MSNRYALALEDQAPRRVTDHVHPRAGDRAQQPVGHLRLVLIERRVHRRDDDVELCEAVVGEVHRAVGADVALDAGQHGDAVEAGVELADGARVLERADLVEAVGHREGLAVIGDRDVLEPGGPGRQRHRLGVGAAVGRGGVHVQVAAEILPLDQPRERPCLGGGNLPAVLPQLGRHERETERLVDALPPSRRPPSLRHPRGTGRTRSA